MRIGILGGTFNPIHNTHLEIARSAQEQLQLERVIFIPARTPPHKQADATLVAAHHRVRMVELAVADFDAFEDFEVSDIEISREGPSYTVDTVVELKEQLGPEAEIFFLMGTDQVLELSTWHQVERIAEMCHLVPVERPGFPLSDLERIADRLPENVMASLRTDVLKMKPSELSASNIREALASGRDVSGLIPKPVLRYIRQHHLYRKTDGE